MMITVIIFIVLLSVLVFAHELGHFLTARFFGVKAEEFGFGFPPRFFGAQRLKQETPFVTAEADKVEVEINRTQVEINRTQTEGSPTILTEKITKTRTIVELIKPLLRWRFIWGGGEIDEEADKAQGVRGGTIYSINWLPLGGFVKIKGEQGDKRNEPDSFSAQAIWKRAIILSAGVMMNVILAAVLLSAGYFFGLPQTLDDLKPGADVRERQMQILQVLPDTPAQASGLAVGDVILSIDGQKFFDYESLSAFVAQQEGKKLRYLIKRGQEERQLEIVPQMMPENKKAGIGIAVAETGIVSYPWWRAIWEGSKTALFISWYIIIALWNLLTGIFNGQEVAANLSGPVGIAVMTGQAARLGWQYLIQFTAVLSVNLAVINYLPFPALDGGRIIFLFLEKLRGRAVPEKVEAIFHNIGFMLLMLLVAIITFKDVFKFSDKFIVLFQRIF